MKKLLLILLCLPMIGFGQLTYVPDDNFEQALINAGYDNVLDDYVITANINTVTSLVVSNFNIDDLTGIEDFTDLEDLTVYGNQLTSLDVSANTALTNLDCSFNQLASLDVSNNIALTELYCDDNQLASLDVSNNPNLTYLECEYNQLLSLDVSNNPNLKNLFCYNNLITSLDVSTNTALIYLVCANNQLVTLDVSNNTSLISLECFNNQLTSLDIRNGNNTNFTFATSFVNNSNLYCIDVSNPIWAIGNWTVSNGSISPWNVFSDSCSIEILGCTDTNACNYDINATINNGSCNFPQLPQIVNLNECDSFLWGGVVYDTSGGPYVDTLITTGGCDSIVYLMVTINNSTSSFDTISTNNSYSWNGNTYTNSGDYSVTTTNSAGCDSIVNLNLTVTTTGISDIVNNKSNLIKITDMLGQETPYRRNTPLLYIYDDGIVKKKIILE